MMDGYASNRSCILKYRKWFVLKIFTRLYSDTSPEGIRISYTHRNTLAPSKTPALMLAKYVTTEQLFNLLKYKLKSDVEITKIVLKII